MAGTPPSSAAIVATRTRAALSPAGELAEGGEHGRTSLPGISGDPDTVPAAPFRQCSDAPHARPRRVLRPAEEGSPERADRALAENSADGIRVGQESLDLRLPGAAEPGVEGQNEPTLAPPL